MNTMIKMGIEGYKAPIIKLGANSARAPQEGGFWQVPLEDIEIPKQPRPDFEKIIKNWGAPKIGFRYVLKSKLRTLKFKYWTFSKLRSLLVRGKN